MKYAILNSSDRYDTYKWFRNDGYILWSLQRKRNLDENDVVLLYSPKHKEIRFLLKPIKILSNSTGEIIKQKIIELNGTKEFQKYKNENIEKIERAKYLYAFILIGELKHGINLIDFSKVPSQNEISYILQNDSRFLNLENLLKSREFIEIKSNQISNSKIFLSKLEIFKNENIKKDGYENKEFKDFVYIKEKDEKEIKSVWQRDAESIKKIKSYFFKYSGKDNCEICNFSFKDILNSEYIEIHHIISRSQQSIEKKYKNLKEVKKDFMFLCSNCHKLADRIESIDKNSFFYMKYNNLLKKRILNYQYNT